VRQGWFDESDADELERNLRSNPGDQTHPPGPVRAAHVKDCILMVGSANARMTRRSSSPTEERGADSTSAAESRSVASAPSERPTAATDASLNAVVDAITDLPPFEEKSGAQVTKRDKFTATISGYCKITIDETSTWLVKPNPAVPESRGATFDPGAVTANVKQFDDGWFVQVRGSKEDSVIEVGFEFPEVDGKQRDGRYFNAIAATVAKTRTSDEARRLRGLFQKASRACNGTSQAPSQ
jgi:hypothetical protein